MDETQEILLGKHLKLFILTIHQLKNTGKNNTVNYISTRNPMTSCFEIIRIRRSPDKAIS